MTRVRSILVAAAAGVALSAAPAHAAGTHWLTGRLVHIADAPPSQSYAIEKLSGRGRLVRVHFGAASPALRDDNARLRARVTATGRVLPVEDHALACPRRRAGIAPARVRGPGGQPRQLPRR